MKYSWIIGAALSVAPCIFSSTAQAEDVKGLTVIVNFGNQSTTTAAPPCSSLPTAFTAPQQWNLYKLINEVNHSSTGNTGSLRDYYFDNSRGKLNLTSDVVVVDLDKIPANERCNFENGSDGFDKVNSFNGARTITLASGPMAEIINKSLCKLGDRTITDNCSDPAVGLNIQYSVVAADGTITPKTTPYEFFKLSTGPVLYNSDWLDLVHIVGQETAIHFLGDTPASRNPIEPQILQTYRFIQFLVPTDDSNNYGSRMGAGLWPRSLPHLKASPLETVNLLSNDKKGLNGIPLGRVQLLPIAVSNPKLGTMAHETGHTLFGFKDYYDTQQLPYKSSMVSGCTDNVKCYVDNPQASQAAIGNGKDKPGPDASWFESVGVADLSLMGKSGSTNPPLIDAPHREKAGWETPVDLSQAVEGTTTYTLDWHADGSIPNTARSFKYCKPNSNVKECFYLESRINGDYRDAGSLRPLYSKITAQDGGGAISNDVSGMLIWHAEHYLNAFDYNINQRKEHSPGLHFDVSVVEADGNYDLMQNRSTASPLGKEKLFGNSATFFDDYNSAAKARWWDGTPSGLSISDINFGLNNTMTFKIGKRPPRPLFFDFDETKFDVSLLQIGTNVLPTPRVLVPSEVQLIPPGSVKLAITPKNNAALSYKVVSNQFRSSATFTGARQVTITNSDFKDNIIKIVLSNPSTVIKSFKVMMDQGARVIFHSPSLGNTIEVDPVDYLKSGTSMILSKNCYSTSKPEPECEPMALFATPKPGFTITGWSVLYNDNSSDSGADARIKLNPLKVDQVKLIRARAERTTNLCAANIEDWRWDGEYSDLGVLVKDPHPKSGGSVYSSNLPRNNFYERRISYAFPSVLWAPYTEPFRPGYTNQTIPWTKEEVCQGAVQTPISCTNLEEWKPYTTYDGQKEVVYNNRRWKMNKFWSTNVLGNGAVGVMPSLQWETVGVMPPLQWDTTKFNAASGIPAGLIPPGVHNEIWIGSTRSINRNIWVLDQTDPSKYTWQVLRDDAGDPENIGFDLGLASIYSFRKPEGERLYFQSLPSMWQLRGKCF